MLYNFLKKHKHFLLPWYDKAQIASIKAAAVEQKLTETYQQLGKIVPDLTEQYTTFKIDNEFRETKVRTQHSFQMKLALKAIDIVLADKAKHNSTPPSRFTIVDIGDSSGTHLRYLNAILKDDKRFSGIDSMSVNLDKVAVEKIKAKGLNAIQCKAEELHQHNISADLLMSFEMVEHLYSPIDFLDSISKESECEYLVITVPYLQQSRVGLHHIRQQQHRIVYPENTHIFELSPPDWKLIFQHSGWHVLDEMTYYQYPRRSFWRIMQPVWKLRDFEGFYGAILKKDRGWADCYQTE